MSSVCFLSIKAYKSAQQIIDSSVTYLPTVTENVTAEFTNYTNATILSTTLPSTTISASSEDQTIVYTLPDKWTCFISNDVINR